MSVPMRKDEFDDELTTADLAQGKRPVLSENRQPPVPKERVVNDLPPADRVERQGGDRPSNEGLPSDRVPNDRPTYSGRSTH
jgi:hypothetical protein